jgi:coproporphyrinogen III oxidase
MIKNLEHIFKNSQEKIIESFSKVEKSNAARTTFDKWKRPEGGGGQTFVIESGAFFDNCAVNFSSISGKKLPKAALGNALVKSSNNGYQAMGLSVISHPKNPYIPTSHLNIRLFCILDRNKEIREWWAGGGYDLTPYISFKSDNIKWHDDAKALLNSYNKSFYKKFSKNCNEYFYIPHRNERRGVGGIFFDNFTQMNLDKTTEMLSSIADQYLSSYMHIANKRKKTKFNKEQKDFQLLRRGRYAEFNLVNDRGTAFGLQSNGRIQSILASLPKDVKWSYKKDDSYIKREKQLLKHINSDWNV